MSYRNNMSNKRDTDDKNIGIKISIQESNIIDKRNQIDMSTEKVKNWS